MELYPIYGGSPYPFYFLFPTTTLPPPPNHVHWTQTPDSHLYTADLPGVRKEEIRVEVEDSRYLVIRTEFVAAAVVAAAEGGERRRDFMRKFRLPESIDVDGISAGYEDGVLTVRVPKFSSRRRRPAVDEVIDVTAEGSRNSVARAA